MPNSSELCDGKVFSVESIIKLSDRKNGKLLAVFRRTIRMIEEIKCILQVGCQF